MARNPLITATLPQYRYRSADDAQALNNSNHLQEITLKSLQAAQQQCPDNARHKALYRLASITISETQAILEQIDSDEFLQNYDTLMATRTAQANVHHLWTKLLETSPGEDIHDQPNEEQSRALFAARLEYYTPQLEDALTLVADHPTQNLTSFRTADLLRHILVDGFSRTDVKLNQPHKEPTLIKSLQKAHSAAGQYTALAKRFNEQLITDVPETFSNRDSVLRESGRFLLPPVGPIVGLHVTYLESGDINTDDTYAWAAFYYQGRKHIMSIRDPFPAGTHRIHAANITTAVTSGAIDLTNDQRISARLQKPLLSHILRQTGTADAAIKENIHDLNPRDVETGVALAAKHGLPKSLRAAMIRILSRDKPNLDRRLSGGQVAHRQTFTPEQALSLVKTAREAGIDEYAIEEILQNAGHNPQDMGIDAPFIEDDDLEQLRRDLIKARINEATAARMVEGIQMPPHGMEP